jgi:hypothetical protein
VDSIPLDLQRRLEQRWAAKFARPEPISAPRLENQNQQLAAPIKVKKKTRRVEPTGLKSVPLA